MQVALFVVLALLAAGCSGSAAQSTPTLVPLAAAPTVASPAELPTLPPPSPSPTPNLTPLVVYGTGGEGVSIRRTPSTSGERIEVWPDGTILLPSGEERQADDHTWKRVRDPRNNDGWAAADFLVDQATYATLPTPEPTRAAVATVAATVEAPARPLPELRPTFTPAPAGPPAAPPAAPPPPGPQPPPGNVLTYVPGAPPPPTPAPPPPTSPPAPTSAPKPAPTATPKR